MMVERRLDRRVERTRKLLREALMALVLEKGYEAVTVQEIIDRANVGRSTFYTHFLDKQQLFLSGFEELHASLAEQQLAAESPPARQLCFSRAMFEHACSYKQVYRALIGKQSGVVVDQRMRQLLTALVHEELLQFAPGGTAPIPRELVTEFVVSTFMSLLRWLADQEAVTNAAQIDAYFQQLTMPGVLAGLGIGDALPLKRSHQRQLQV